ncbi:MAG TPA: zinc ribbon domain-containing protein [Polyangiales bacterium]
MPMYEYQCGAHGVFEAMRSLKDSASATPCPACGDGAKRILSAPRLAQMEASQVKARDRNERSRHEPRVSNQKPHGQPMERSGERPALQRSPSPRPWVLEHH